MSLAGVVWFSSLLLSVFYTVWFRKPHSSLTTLLPLKKKKAHTCLIRLKYARMLAFVLTFFFFPQKMQLISRCVQISSLKTNVTNVNCFHWLWKVPVCFSAYENIIRKYLFQTRFQYTWLTRPHYLCKYFSWWMSSLNTKYFMLK